MKSRVNAFGLMMLVEFVWNAWLSTGEGGGAIEKKHCSY